MNEVSGASEKDPLGSFESSGIYGVHEGCFFDEVNDEWTDG